VARAHALTKQFYDRDAIAVAPELLNKVLVGNGVSARLVEVEAYRSDTDPGSHAFRGRTPRNASMFAAPGTLYVYFSYGNHWCMNAVCGPGERAHAVLLRAAAPLTGLDVMRGRRVKARRDRELTSGPGRLGQAFAADRSLDGTSLLRGPLRIVDDGTLPPASPGVSTRIGLAIGKGEDLPYRFYVPGDPNISRPPRPRQ
jgi:DNA-3-methyladenine glycosylase